MANKVIPSTPSTAAISNTSDLVALFRSGADPRTVTVQKLLQGAGGGSDASSLDIDGLTAIAASTLAAGDLFILHDVSADANRELSLANLASKLADGASLEATSGVLGVKDGGIDHDMLGREIVGTDNLAADVIPQVDYVLPDAQNLDHMDRHVLFRYGSSTTTAPTTNPGIAFITGTGSNTRAVALDIVTGILYRASVTAYGGWSAVSTPTLTKVNYSAAVADTVYGIQSGDTGWAAAATATGAQALGAITTIGSTKWGMCTVRKSNGNYSSFLKEGTGSWYEVYNDTSRSDVDPLVGTWAEVPVGKVRMLTGNVSYPANNSFMPSDAHIVKRTTTAEQIWFWVFTGFGALQSGIKFSNRTLQDLGTWSSPPTSITVNQTKQSLTRQTSADNEDKSTSFLTLKSGSTTMETDPIQCLSTSEIWKLKCLGVLYCGAGRAESIGVEFRFQYAKASSENGTYGSWTNLNTGLANMGTTHFRSKLVSGQLDAKTVLASVTTTTATVSGTSVVTAVNPTTDATMFGLSTLDGSRYRDYSPAFELPFQMSVAASGVAANDWVKFRMQLRKPDSAFATIDTCYAWYLMAEALQEVSVSLT